MVKVNIYDNCNDIIAHLPAVRTHVFRTAQEKGAIARGYLMAHRSGSSKYGHSEITVTSGSEDVDAFVNLDDTRSQSAAGAIEAGNRYGGGGIDVLGRTFGLS